MRGLKNNVFLIILSFVPFLAKGQNESLKKDSTIYFSTAIKAGKAVNSWKLFAQQNVVPLRDIYSDNYDDLQFLKKVFRDKRIVMLGESSHGVEEFSGMKVRLIKFLHEQMGFEVVAFESDLGKCFSAEFSKEQMYSNERLRNCANYVWNTDKVLQLMNYIQQDSLMLAGFDIQFGVSHCLKVFYEAIDTNLGDKIYSNDSLMSYTSFYYEKPNGQYGVDKKTFMIRMQDVLNTYLELKNELDEKHTSFLSKNINEFKLKVIKQILSNRIDLTKHILRNPDHTIDFAFRDTMMAANIDWLVEDLYKNKKIIVWAHNDHICKNGIDFTVMGKLISEEIKKESYVVGLFMGSGITALNNRKTLIPVSYPPKNSMESVFLSTRYKYGYLDISKLLPQKNTEWLFNRVNTLDWGVKTRKLNLAKCFDGILFISSVSPPLYME